MGHAYLTWAFSEAAVLFLREHPEGQTSLTTLDKQHGTGKALTVLAQQLARAVSSLRKRGTAFARATCLHGEGRGVGEPAASLGHQRMSLERPCSALRSPCVCERPCAPRHGILTLRDGLDACSRSCRSGESHRQLTWAAPHPHLARTGARQPCSLPCAEDGMRVPRCCSVAEARASSLCNRHLDGGRTAIRVWCRHVPSAPVDRNQARTRDWLPTAPSPTQRKKK